MCMRLPVIVMMFHIYSLGMKNTPAFLLFDSLLKNSMLLINFNDRADFSILPNVNVCYAWWLIIFKNTYHIGGSATIVKPALNKMCVCVQQFIRSKKLIFYIKKC